MDKSAARSLSEALKKHMEDFEEVHDIKVTIGSGKFDSTTLTLKVELAELTDSGEALTRAANEFKRMAISYGLTPADLGREFSDGMRTYKIVGCKPRCSRYPILAESLSDKKKYKFSPNTIKLYLGKSPVKRSEEAILNELREVDICMSPENISCDGEASAAQVQQQSAQLNARKRALIAELGREPTHRELYPHIYEWRK